MNGAPPGPGQRYRPEVAADRAVLSALDQRLEALSLIDTPVWVYDPERCQFLWANAAALQMWQSPGIEELRGREIGSTQSEAMYALALSYLKRTQAGEALTEWVTLELGGVRRRYTYRFHGLALADGRDVLLMEGRAAPTAEELLAFTSDHTLTVGLYELDGSLASANPAFRTLAEHQPLDDLNALLAGVPGTGEWADSVERQTVLVFETTLATHAGDHPFLGELRGVLSQSGQPRALLTLHDLTEQRLKEAEQALRDNQIRMAHYLERAGIATYDCDLVQGVCNPDPRWMAMLGYPPSAHSIPMDVWESHLHPDDAASVVSAWRSFVTGKRQQWAQEYRMRCADGSYRWVLDRGVVTRRDAAGLPQEVIGIGLDVSERKHMEAALAQSEMRQRALLGALPDLIVIIDADGRFVDVHASRIEDWGLSPDRLLGHTVDEVLHPKLAADFYAHQPQVLATGRPAHGHFHFDHPALGRCYREYTTVPYGATQTLTVVRDVTARRQAEEQRQQAVRQMQQAQKMEALGQLTGGVAHDFNNILASILGYAWLARQRPSITNDASAADYLQVITAAGERGRELVEKLMIFSRRGEYRAVEAIDVIPVVEEAFRMLKSVIPTRLSLQLELPASAPAVAVDPVELQQVLVNLVVNARDAVGVDGTVTVGVAMRRAEPAYCTSCLAEVADGMLEVCVRDTGSGIPAAVLSRIFDPFFTTKDVGSGTGIGLSVVDGIVHRAGGHVVVLSEPGIGTQFQILLPLATAPAAAPRVDTAPDAPWSAGSGRLMVVDDEAWVSEFLRELLEELGYEVETFSNGQDALAALDAAAEPYAALITDLTMPQMTGLELARIVSARLPSLPIVLCTGASEPPAPDLLRAAGICRVVPKPVPVEELRTLLATLIPS